MKEEASEWLSPQQPGVNEVLQSAARVVFLSEYSPAQSLGGYHPQQRTNEWRLSIPVANKSRVGRRRAERFKTQHQQGHLVGPLAQVE
jgi:hypothetical protein